MPNDFQNVSDETLFLNMSHGDKTAQAILLMRFEKIGFQYAALQIKQNNLKDYRDIDFIDLIDETIYKAFRYFSVGEVRFWTFCSELLNQAISQKISEILADHSREKEAIRLDAPIGKDNGRCYHELVSDTAELRSPKDLDIDLFLDNYEKTTNPRTKMLYKVFLLCSFDMSIKQAASKLGLTYYVARSYYREAKMLFKQSDTIKLK